MSAILSQPPVGIMISIIIEFESHFRYVLSFFNDRKKGKEVQQTTKYSNISYINDYDQQINKMSVNKQTPAIPSLQYATVAV